MIEFVSVSFNCCPKKNVFWKVVIFEYTWVFRLDQERSVRQLLDSCKYLLHPFGLAKSNVAHITTEYETISIGPRQRVSQSFSMKVRLETVAVKAVLLSALHLPFETRHAIDTVILAADKRVPRLNRLPVHVARYYHSAHSLFCHV